MSVKSVTLTLNGQTYNIPQTQGSTYSVQVSAPSKSSYNQPDHIYPMSIRIEDQAGNITEITKSHATYGDLCKLRVLEKVAPGYYCHEPQLRSNADPEYANDQL